VRLVIRPVQKSRRPSYGHPNRLAHNWLTYDAMDKGLIAFADLYRGELIDLGAGFASYRDFFLQHADNYIAVDWPNSYHDTKVNVFADLGVGFPLKSEIADTVVALSVLEHIREPQNFLEEACRILKPGGALILQVPWQWSIHEAPHDYFRYTPYGLEHLLARTGLAELRVEPQSGFFSMIILKMNYFSLRLLRRTGALQEILRPLFLAFWYVGQKLAPLLDRLDKDWKLEASGYFVTAKKPCH
jgi:SAM-dependent methyltransferase